MAEWKHHPCGVVTEGTVKVPPPYCNACLFLGIRPVQQRTGWTLVSRKHLEQKPKGKGRRTPSKHLRERVYERDGYACVECGCDDKALLTTDHKVPWSKGGRTTFENLQTMCGPCNTAKGNALVGG